MKVRQALAALGVFFVCSITRGAIVVHFDQSQYTITPGETFTVQVLLDMDDATPGDQVPAAGLFSMGFKVSFDGAKAQVVDVSSIVLPAALNGNGVGGPPDKAAGLGHAGAAGALDLLATDGYKSALLGTITIKDLSPDPYTLSLGKYYPTKTNFMDFAGNDLDSQITFGTAGVVVVPEPACAILVGCLGSLMLLRRRRA